MSLLLYGATGYTGQLIVEYAGKYGLQPILAGRSEAKVKALATQWSLPWRVADLNNPASVDALLEGIQVVLHAAGPFQHTAKAMMEGCLRNQVHYLDITGEIAVFESAARLDERAKTAGIMLLPGAGFDVVPTDCLALYLKNKLPDATHLQLAFASGAGLSHGTATTMAENLGQGGAVRLNGKITRVPVLGHKTMTVPFPGKSLFVMTIPWGDVSTAFYSTGIPNIETYTGVSPSSFKWIKWQRYFNWLLRTSFVRNLVKSRIQKRPAGPSPEKRKKAISLVWGKVSNGSGKSAEATLRTPEGYTLTALTSLLIAKKVLNGSAPIGFQTPAKAYGAELIMEIEGVERHDL
ncbi:MAG: saccharopine dehydrogenase NADP-binding domain-containing protein [Saprospiraceae bacterium]|nr:saccharopine dehydrogenase NADP-binding domain-containing protein [Saprospiraceae bacterium]